LADVQHEAEKVLATLPEAVLGSARIKDGFVHVDIRAGRLKTFTLVLGSEASEIVYAAEYIQFCLIGEGMEAQIEFTQETISAIAEFLLSDRVPLERTSRIFKRPYLLFPMADGAEWRLSKFRK
jgi:hypothetical protein